MKPSSITRILIGALLATLGAFAAVFALWSWSGGETTSALAALAEPTTTPIARATRTAQEKVERKQAKQSARAEIASGVRPQAGLTKEERKAAKQATKAERKAAKQANKQARGAKKIKNKANKIARGFGTVTFISPGELGLDTTLRGAKMFVLDENTKLAVVGVPDATTADISIGDKALVRGGKKKPAKFLLAAPSSYTIEHIAAGKITSLDGETITLKNKKHDLTVTVNNDTQILDREGNTLVASDLVVNSKIMILGIPNGSDQLQAQILFRTGNKQK